MSRSLRRVARALCATAALLAPAASAVPGTEPAVAPSPAQLDREIARLGEERSRAGSDAQRERIDAALAQLWVLRARAHVEAGKGPAAADAYERALDLDRDLLPALAELGFLQLRAGEDDRALLLADEGLLHHPGNGWLLELRAEVYYRDGRLADALPEYEAALAAREGDEGLARRVEKVRRELAAEGSHDRALSAHFTLSFDGERDEAAGALIEQALERAYDELVRELQAYPPRPIPVVLYTREEFHDTTRTGSEVAGLFDGKIRLPAGGITRLTPGLERVVRHELAHALIAAKGPGDVPRWLHEGLAQLLEPRDPESAAEAARTLLAGMDEPSLDPFSYQTALSFTGYLDEQYGRARLLWLLDLLAGGSAESEACSEAYGTSCAGLVSGWARTLAR